MGVGNMTLYINETDHRIIMNNLKQLKRIEQNQAINRGLKAGIKEILTPGKVNLLARHTMRKGNTLYSMGHQMKRRTRRGNKAIYGGFLRPFGAAAHLIDAGTKERWTKKGAYRGKVNPSHFWADAIYDNGDKALKTLMDTIYFEIDRIMNN